MTTRAAKRLIAPALLLAASAAIGAPWLTEELPENRGTMFYVAGTVVGLAFSWVIARLLDLVVWGAFEVRDVKIPKLLKEMSSLAVFLAGGVLILMLVFHKSVTGILATSGVIGLILGLGMRGLIADVFAGVALNVDQPFRVGQWIQVHPRSVEPFIGCVTEITWRSTRLRTISNNLVVVPNSLASEIILLNFSEPSPRSRFELTFVIDFHVPVDQALRVLLAGARSAKGPLAEPPPKVTVTRALDWGLEYEVRYWLEPARVSPRKGRHAVTTSIVEHLHHAGISLARRKEEVFFARQSRPAPTRLDKKASILKRVDLFRELEQDEFEQLAEQMRERSFKAGQVVVEKGQPGQSMYILVEGVMDVYTSAENSNQRIKVHTIHPGEFFGEMSLLTGEPRSATVMAVTDSVAYEISKEDLAALFDRRPEIMMLLTQIVAERLDELKARGGESEVAAPAQRASFSGQILERVRAFFGG